MNDLLRFKLANGMHFLAFDNPANPTISFAFRIANGGHITEDAKVGLEEFAAAVFRKGTEKRTGAELSEAIDALGMDISFSPGKHTSMLSGRVMTEHFPAAISICREMLESSAPSEDEIARMKQRMTTGLTMQLDDPATVAADKVHEMIYGSDHPYGISIRRRLECINSISREDVISHFRRFIRPGAIMAIAAGDLSTIDLKATAEKAFSGWDSGGSFTLTPFTPAPLPSEPKMESITIPGKTQSDIALGWQGISRFDDDYYPLLVGNTVLGRMGLGGRIGQRVREKEGMAYYAFTTFSAGVGAGPFQFRAGVDPKNIGKTIAIALEELERARDEGLEQQEIDDARKYLAGAMARQMETNGGLATVLLNQELYGLGDDYYRRFPHIINSLSLEDVNNALARNLKPEARCCAVAGPQQQIAV